MNNVLFRTKRRLVVIGVIGLIGLVVVGVVANAASQEDDGAQFPQGWDVFGMNAKDVPLDCLDGWQGITLASAVPEEPRATPDNAPAGPVPSVLPAPGLRLPAMSATDVAENIRISTLHSSRGRTRALLEYSVENESHDRADVVGRLGGRRVLLAPAIRRGGGEWTWQNAQLMPTETGPWVLSGGYVALCADELRRPA